MSLGDDDQSLGLQKALRPLKPLSPLGLSEASQRSEPHDLQSMRKHMIWRDLGVLKPQARD